ncbi:MAG: DNA-binding response regulator [Alphaproteobacteria bacterium CG11_big_fil_rev_8_21_14_0_20_44_7]|nr:MAG: DNA-binding response regulator [Alphaproteobacteria bacterium CG11_big_fil_rev_8_21_14_0_20_44_7]
MVTKKNTILIIDDEPQIRKFLRITLEADGFKTEEAENGAQGIRMASSIKPDLVLLDLGLPDMDGTEVIPHIRDWSQLPIIVVSVRDQDKDVVQALDLGADDFMSKPFSADVLIARINSALRKAAKEEAGTPEIQNGGIKIDLVKHEVLLEGEKIALSPKEYELLRYFIVNKGKMLTHRQILKEVWGPAHVDDTQYLRVYVGQLREKIKDVESQRYITTEAGIGYRMENLVEAAAA